MLCYKIIIIVALLVLFTAMACFVTPLLSPKCRVSKLDKQNWPIQID